MPALSPDSYLTSPHCCPPAAARYQYDEVMEEAFELEDIVKCRQLHDYTPRVEGIPSQFTKAVWYYK